jgi:AraC-like DNA-binding protein
MTSTDEFVAPHKTFLPALAPVSASSLVMVVMNSEIKPNQFNQLIRSSSRNLLLATTEEALLSIIGHLIVNGETPKPQSAVNGDDAEHFSASLQLPSITSNRGGLAPSILRRIRAHIDAHLAEKIDIDQLAKLAGLSTSHFSRAFKQCMGLSPHHYLLVQRIDRAAALIKNTDCALIDIALDTGFSDQCHLTRMFVRQMHETPMAYRRRHR